MDRSQAEGVRRVKDCFCTMVVASAGENAKRKYGEGEGEGGEDEDEGGEDIKELIDGIFRDDRGWGGGYTGAIREIPIITTYALAAAEPPLDMILIT